MQHPLQLHEPPGLFFVVNFVERVRAWEAHVKSGSELPNSLVAHNDASHEAESIINQTGIFSWDPSPNRLLDRECM